MKKIILDSFLDELEKLSEVNLSGISPQALLEGPQREPMVTTGFDRARQILSRTEVTKTSARKPNKEDYSKTRRYIAPVAGGGATGALLGSLTSMKAPIQKHRIIGAAIGAGTGLVDAAIRHHKSVKKEGSHMAKTKVAVAMNTEETNRMIWTYLTRAETRAQAHTLFSSGASEASKKNRAQLKDLFVQEGANQNPGVNMEKTAASRVEALAASIQPSVYERYPELQKVSAATRVRPDLKPRVSTSAPLGKSMPTVSELSGGNG